jgi:hypothetical protein
MNAQILTTKHIIHTVTNKITSPFLSGPPLSFPHAFNLKKKHVQTGKTSPGVIAELPH